MLEGEVGAWLPAGIEVLRQRGDGLDERLAHAFVDIGGPTLIIGMDTPQVQSMTLARALAGLRAFPAILGPALDGGYWAVGLRRLEPRALFGVR